VWKKEGKHWTDSEIARQLGGLKEMNEEVKAIIVEAIVEMVKAIVEARETNYEGKQKPDIAENPLEWASPFADGIIKELDAAGYEIVEKSK
jgi:hypothetical protein